MYYQILSSKQNEDNQEKLIFFLRQIHSIKEQANFPGMKNKKEKSPLFALKTQIVLRLNIWKDEQQKVCFAVSTNVKQEQIKRVLENTYGAIAIRELDAVPTTTTAGRRIVARNDTYQFDNTNFLSGIIQNIPEGCMVTMDISKAIEPVKTYIQKEERRVLKNKKVHNSSENKGREKDLKLKLEHANYMYEVDMVVSATEQRFEVNVYNFCKHIRFLTEGQYNSLKVKLFSSGGVLPKIRMQHKSKIFLNEKEMADVVRIPSVEAVGNLVYSATEEVDTKSFEKGIKVGEHILPNGEKIIIRIPLNVLTKHMFLCGATGGGKSAALLTMLDDFILTHNMEYGYTLIDPKEETAIKVINHLLYFESIGYQVDWNKVHYIDLADSEYVTGLNLLNIPTKHVDIDKIQGNLMDLFNAVYRVGDTPNMDKMLRNMLGTLLLEKGQKNTIIDGHKLMTDPKRQRKAKANLGSGYYEQMYKQFWDNPPSSKDIQSILNRLNLFQTPQMQRMYGLPRFDLEIRKWMDEGHIVLINSKGLDEQKTRLNVGHILAQYTMVALERPTTGAKEHAIIFDEGKQTQLPIIEETMIPMLRGFGIPVIFCTQSIVSVKKSLADEMKENVTTMLSARLGADGAPKLANMMNHRVAADEFQKLPDLTLLLSTQNSSSQFQTVEIAVQPPFWYVKGQNGVFRVAAYHDKDRRAIEENMAGQISRDKILELQKRDWRHKDEIDKMLAERYSESINIHPEEVEEYDEDFEESLHSIFD